MMHLFEFGELAREWSKLPLRKPGLAAEQEAKLFEELARPIGRPRNVSAALASGLPPPANSHA